MKIRQLSIKNFRGVSNARLLLSDHVLLVGDNNVGKSTILEAIDLVLGPERISRIAAIDEHDFYASQYISEDENPIKIEVEVTILDLNEEQQRYFNSYIEYWDDQDQKIFEESVAPAQLAQDHVKEAIRITFIGEYDREEDDFIAQTFYTRTLTGDENPVKFGKFDKRKCGFLYLRTLRTGSRALSLERGSLLDIILRLRELRPQMWEKVIAQLKDVTVAEDPTLGLSDILEEVQRAIQTYVPADWGSKPRLRVSHLTREHLRRVLTVFMATGAGTKDSPHYAPFQHQGTGTINLLVLALLSMIAREKQTVIFAMEEPEIAIPPYTQKRIVNSIKANSVQTLFTSHSPYVVEEFKPEEILVLNRGSKGEMNSKPFNFPPKVKAKNYSSQFRKQFAEAILAKRILVAEGATEASSYSAAARRLSELEPNTYAPLEALGIAVVNAETDSQVEPYCSHFQEFDKTVFAVFDKQKDPAISAAIQAASDKSFEATQKGFEKLILEEVDKKALKRYALKLVTEGRWPSHLHSIMPSSKSTDDEIHDALFQFMKKKKGEGVAAEILTDCDLGEMPAFVKTAIAEIKSHVENSTTLHD